MRPGQQATIGSPDTAEGISRDMKRILGLAGSLRRASFNRGLLRAAAEECPAGGAIEIGSIDDVPLYNAEIEDAGLPEGVQRLRAELEAADALLMVTPEYNNGVPGVFKNAIDWMSSRKAARLFDGKPIAIIGASTGRFGTTLAQAHWLPVLRTLRAKQWHGGRLLVSHAGAAFDADGNLTDPKVREDLRTYLEGFVASL